MKQKQAKTLNTTQQLINLTNQKMKLSRSKARKWKDRYKTKQYIFLCFCTTYDAYKRAKKEQIIANKHIHHWKETNTHTKETNRYASTDDNTNTTFLLITIRKIILCWFEKPHNTPNKKKHFWFYAIMGVRRKQESDNTEWRKQTVFDLHWRMEHCVEMMNTTNLKAQIIKHTYTIKIVSPFDGLVKHFGPMRNYPFLCRVKL